MKGDAIFNPHLERDLFYLDSRPELHITDKDLKYTAVEFVNCPNKNPTTAQIWDTFLQAWSLIGMPDIVKIDRGTQFGSQEF